MREKQAFRDFVSTAIEDPGLLNFKVHTMKRRRTASPPPPFDSGAAASRPILVHIKQQHKDPSLHDESDEAKVVWSQFNIVKTIRECVQRYGEGTPVVSEGCLKTATQSDVTPTLRRIGTEEFGGPLPPFESLSFLQRKALYEFGAAKCLFYAGELEALHAAISEEDRAEIDALTNGGLRIHTAATPSEKSFVLYQLTTRRERAAIDKVSELFADGRRVVLLVYGAFHDFGPLAMAKNFELVEVGIPPIPARAPAPRLHERSAAFSRGASERASSPPIMTDEEFEKRRRFNKKYELRFDLLKQNPELKEELERNRELYNAEYDRRRAAGMKPWNAPAPTDRPTSPDEELPSEDNSYDDSDDDSDDDGHLGISRLQKAQTKADLAELGVPLASLKELDKDARRLAVRRVYMALARTHHPDKGGSEDVFKRIDAAKTRLIGGKRAKINKRSSPKAQRRSPRLKRAKK